MKRKKQFHFNSNTVFTVGIYLVAIIAALLWLYPLVFVISASVSDPQALLNGDVLLFPVGFNLNAYEYIFKNNQLLVGYGNTIFYTVVGTACSLTCTAMAAYALARRKMVGQNLFSWMITITMFFGGGLIPTFLTVSNYGLTDTRWSMILPYLINTWNLIVMRSFFIAYPNEIIESGEIDVLRDPGVFLKLVLPTSKAALATIGLYYAVAYWNAYMPSLLYLDSQHADMRPVMHLLQTMIKSVNGEDMNGGGQEGTHMVGATIRYCSIMIVVTPIMCVYPFIQKYFVKGVMVGSVKG